MINTFITEIEYRKAFKEVYEILKCISNEELEKIPSDIQEIIKENMQLDYDYKIDLYNFENQEMSDITKAILSILYTNYWAAEEEKTIIKLQEKNELEKLEEEKRIKYNPDNIFKNKKTQDNEINKNVELIQYRENIFQRIINFLKKAFKNNS